jgi:hypothetical protein
MDECLEVVEAGRGELDVDIDIPGDEVGELDGAEAAP